MGKGPLENTVEDYLVDKVKALGGVALKGAVPGRRFLDRIVILPGGRTIYVECKRPIGGRHSVHQGETLERLQALGHEIARVKTRAEVDTMLAPPPQTQVTVPASMIEDGSPLVTDLIREFERARRQWDEFQKTGVSTAAIGSYDLCFSAVLKKHFAPSPETNLEDRP